jgi:hypothetical protein
MITATQADFMIEELGSKFGQNETYVSWDVVEKTILENTERNCSITKGQCEYLLHVIQENFEWAARRGCTVADARVFIELIIRKESCLWEKENGELA